MIGRHDIDGKFEAYSMPPRIVVVYLTDEEKEQWLRFVGDLADHYIAERWDLCEADMKKVDLIREAAVERARRNPPIDMLEKI